MSAKRSVLLLAEQYYPLQVPSTFRIHSFARHLPTFGYDCHVIAPAWNPRNLQYVSHARDVFPGTEDQSPCSLTQVPVDSVRRQSRLMSYLRPFREGLNIRDDMVRAGRTLWARSPFQAIVATAPAYYPLRAAMELSALYRVPLIADLRDVYGEHEGSILRTPAQHMAHALKGLAGKRAIARRELVRMCNAAAFTTTVSQPLADVLCRLGVRRPAVILNGFDPDDFEAPVHPATDRFRITYAGTVHPFQNPEPFFAALDQLVTDGRIGAGCFQVEFYTRRGTIGPWMAGRPCASVVAERPLVEKRDIHPVLLRSCLLLHLSSATHEGGILTSKITEYLGARRPILTVTGDQDVVDAFLRETNSGVALREPADIAAHLWASFEHWRRTGSIQYDGCAATRSRYTRETQCRRLASLLDLAIAESA